MTAEQRWLSRRYIGYRTLTEMWFMGAVWLYFYRLFITDQQVGILDGMAFAIGLVAEVPSGALADRIGRDRAIRIGQCLAGAGLLAQAAGSSFVPLFVGQAILMIGLSLVSGADDALFFDRLGFAKESTQWRKLVTRGLQVSTVAYVSATIFGGWMHTINPRIPWILTGLAFVGSALLIWSVKDNRERRARQPFVSEVKHYASDIRIGFAQFRTPQLRNYVPIMLVLQGLFYTYDYGLLRLVLLDRFGFSPFWGTVVVGSCSLVVAIVLAYMHRKADSLSERRVIITIGVAAAMSLILTLADIGPWGYVVILALHAGENIMAPFMSELLNNRAPSDQRATVLSVASFFKNLPYVLLAPLIGWLSTNGDLDYFLIGWAGLIAVSLTIYTVARHGDTKVVLAE